MNIKLKKAADKIITLTGYANEVERNDGYLTLNTGDSYPYVLPDGYVCVTMHDDFGNEWYVLAHKDMEVTA